MLVRENGATLELFRAVPDHWWEGEGIKLEKLPTTFGFLDLRASRANSAVTVELALTEPPPDRVTLRYPAARRAVADGRLCDIDGDVISSAHFRRLVIDY